MSSETALAVVPPEKAIETPAKLMGAAQDVANVCREIVTRTSMDLQGKRYVKVEGWMSIAAAYACAPSIREVTEDERGVRAVAELRRHDGTVLATAEGFVGLDEPRWANQPAYARRGMAQTRAVSRVCRSVFAFVVTLIDPTLQTTPAEEIPVEGEVVAAAPVVRAAPAATGRPAERSNRTRVNFGKSKGKHLADLEASDLQWHRAAAQKAVAANDPSWHSRNQEWLALVEAEIATRVAGPGVAPGCRDL